MNESRWFFKNENDVKSLADRLDGKKLRDSWRYGKPIEEWEFPTIAKAKRFQAVLKALGAYERLVDNSSRIWGCRMVEVSYRKVNKTDELNTEESDD